MRVLHIYKDYYPVLGGVENHLRDLAEAQARLGLEVTVLVTNDGFRTTSEELHGVKVIRAGRLAVVSSTPLSLALPRILARLRSDITHLHFPYPLGEVAQLLLGRNGHTVMTYHSDVVRQKRLLRLYRPLLWQVLHKTERIIATSPNYIRSSPFLNRLPDKCVAIPLGVDVNRFDQASPQEVAAIRQRYGAPLLLFVGRLRYYKGLNFLIEAMPQIAAHLLIIGSGPLLAEWSALATGLEVAERVHFIGEVPDEHLPAYYHAGDILVLPATMRSEAFGTVLVEAMAAGTPVISTELGTGTSWVNIHGETGLVVPPCDPQSLAETVNYLLQNEAVRTQMRARARQRARQEFSTELMVQRVLALYQELLT
jgi:glycosyltransferase involved in cell wall biosynthesis